MESANRAEIKGCPGYWVTRQGRVVHRTHGVENELTIQLGTRKYPVVSLVTKGQSRKFLVHRVVAQAFCPNPENKSYVNHIDGNPLNNDANNLEWCTAAENSKHAHITGLTRSPKGMAVDQVCPTTGNVLYSYGSVLEASKAVGLPSSHRITIARDKLFTVEGFFWRTPQTPIDEHWVLITECDNYRFSLPYSVSDFGRVRSDRNGRILSPATKHGYQHVGLQCIGTTKRSFCVHRLVATGFLENPEARKYVNHKNRNKADNMLSNLEWVSASDNMCHAVGIPVAQVDIFGAPLRRFRSQKEAAVAIGVAPSAINAAIKKSHQSGGFQWRLGSSAYTTSLEETTSGAVQPDDYIAEQLSEPRSPVMELSDADVEELLNDLLEKS